jgi:integrase
MSFNMGRQRFLIFPPLDSQHASGARIFQSKGIKEASFNWGLLTLLATTGLRIQEIAQSRWCDLYYDSGIGEYFLRVKGKRDEIRHALIKKLVFERLQKLRVRKRLSPHLDQLTRFHCFQPIGERLMVLGICLNM